MANRKRKIQLKIWVDEEEKEFDTGKNEATRHFSNRGLPAKNGD